jgi:uncharacterized membrane protein
MRWLHVVAGLSALISGAVALYALKGARLHRKSGMVFVYTMLLMSSTGAVMAVLKPSRLSVIAAVLTFYLVTTALLTVRRPARSTHWTDAVALLVALLVGIAGLAFGFAASSRPSGTIDGLPAAPGFVFGAVGLLAALGDGRLLLGRRIQGTQRIARHLWRMCFALYIATASFFLGQPQIFPKAVRRSGVLAVPVLLVLAVLLYWLVRVKFSNRTVDPRLYRSRLEPAAEND